MEVLRKLLIAVLTISTLTFIAIFGRLPLFRNTPIGVLNRWIWIYGPRSLRNLDRRLTGGRLTSVLARLGNYLMNDQHPVVLLFYLALLIVSECMFVPASWPKVSGFHHCMIPLVVTLPYIFTYLSVTSTSSTITTATHEREMRLYPYDHALFRPGIRCRTCKFLKPARSKHCSICKVCISKHDHHCIWVNNCLGRSNYVYFIGLLLSLSFLLPYGAYLGYIILVQTLDQRLPGGWNHPGQSWQDYFHIWSWAIVQDVRIGAVGLLSLMCTPLAWGLFSYHVYLIWAGMTTNEVSKWADWRAEVREGVVFMGKRSRIIQRARSEAEEPHIDWPNQSDQLLVRTLDGQAPRPRFPSDVGSEGGGEGEGPRWRKVSSLNEVDNIYDRGFVENLLEIFRTE